MVECHIRRFMSTLIRENQKSFNWLTRDMVNLAYTRFKKKRRLEENPAKEQPTIFQIQVDEENNSSLCMCMSDITGETVCSTNENSKDGDNGSNFREKGGRLVGSTTSQKPKREAPIISMKNEITKEYESELKHHKQEGTRLKNGELKQIIE